MHICIVGTGAAGWIACNILKDLNLIKKITIIGSSSIPSIGVGESTTLTFHKLLDIVKDLDSVSFNEIVANTDAAIKNGVMYEGWSPKPFLHYFKKFPEFSSFNDEYSFQFYGRLLANKPKDVFIHDLMGKEIYEESKKNNVLLDQDHYGSAIHFDASKFIDFFSKIALKNPKVKYIDDIVLGGTKHHDIVQDVKLSGGKIEADFFIFATGDKKINTDFLEINYSDFSKILLTNKAVAVPLKYKNKKKEFHPYTVAKTMKNGWRWITPTWSRIGTGYVFSDNHISVEEAIKELKQDIGDPSIDPFVVNFHPKADRSRIRENWCTLGMASGFLEPLDAPGLSMAISSLLNQIIYYLEYTTFAKPFDSSDRKKSEIEKLNDRLNVDFDFWTTFILLQYKTSHRKDTQFWRDHKSVEWDVYDRHIRNLDEYNNTFEKMMFHQTIAGKDINWKSSTSFLPYKTTSPKYSAMNHLEYVSFLRNNT